MKFIHFSFESLLRNKLNLKVNVIGFKIVTFKIF